MSRISDWVLTHRWAITEEALEAIISISEKFNPTNINPETFHKSNYEFDPNDKNVLALSRESRITSFGGEYHGKSSDIFKIGNLGIISVIGPIFPRSNLMTLSGATSLARLSKSFNVAMEDPTIKKVIFEIDSPGGEITDLAAFSDLIYNSQAKKPIISYVSGLGASAAYWIASSSSEIVAAETSEVGSIGVLAVITDTSAKDEKSGIKKHTFVSSVSPRKVPDLNDASSKQEIQAIIDSLGEIFVSKVARNRETTSEDVIENFGKGFILLAKDAINVGMIDSIMSFEQLISREINSFNNHQNRGVHMTQVTDANASQIQAENPGVYQEIHAIGVKSRDAEMNQAVSEAMKKGAQQESERIQAIQKLALPGTEEIISKAIADPNVTCEKVAMEIVAYQKENPGALQVQRDAEDLQAATSGLGSGNADNNDSEKAAIIGAMVSGGNSKRK